MNKMLQNSFFVSFRFFVWHLFTIQDPHLLGSEQGCEKCKSLKFFHQCYSDFCEICVSYFILNSSVGIYNHYNCWTYK